MSYKSLPIGRLRRLSYSNYIQLKRLKRFNRQLQEQIFENDNYNESPDELGFYSELMRILQVSSITQSITPSITPSITLSVTPVTLLVTPIESDDFTNLIDIKKGIISKNLLENSNVKIFNDDTIYLNSICGICREQFIDNNIIRELKCRHHYHINCIDTWFTENKTCPECRFEI